MAEHKLPDSLELLLDTMCNTFGGVMFITISMVIMVTAVSKMLTGGSSAELERQLLEEERSQIAKLEQGLEKLGAELRSMESDAPRYKSGSREEIEQLRKRMRDAAGLESEYRKKLAQLEELQKELLRRQEKNEELEKRLARKEAEVHDALQEEDLRREQLAQEQESLRGEKAAQRPRKIRFAKEEATQLQPYNVILSGNTLFRLGMLPISNAEVEVQLRDKIIKLIPKRGIPISSDIGVVESRRLFSGLDRNRCFARCFVHPDSVGAFVGLRQHLREAGIKLEWVITEEFFLQLTDHPDFSASD